ncbi:hypothetical protein ACK3YN_12760, partial [Aeromonas caviae]
MSPPPSSFLRGVPPPGQSDRTSLVTPLAATSLVRFSCDADSPVVFGLSAPQHAIKKVHRGFPGKAALIFRKKYSESLNP